MKNETQGFLDIDILKVQTMNKKAIELNMVNAFLTYTPSILNEISNALAQSNPGRLAEYFHMLKSSTAILCTPKLKDEMLVLELNAAQVGEDHYNNRVMVMLEKMNVLLAEVACYRDSIK